jgi:signal transduction histidine kinase
MTGSRTRLLVLDQFVALALIGSTVWALATAPPVPVGDAAVAVLAAGAGTVAVRRITPETACAVAIAALAATQQAGTTRTLPVALALVLDFYILGRHCVTRRRAVLAAILLTAAVVILIAGPQGSSVFDVTTSWSFACALPFAAGRVIGHHDAMTASLRVWAGRLARDQQERISAAAQLERARVARELHDVIAHDVSVMVIQAVAARRIAPSDRDGAAKVLDTVEACGRDAMREMRHLVGVLHRDDLDAPRGDVAGLGDLAERARSAGLDVTVRVEGRTAPLPAALELTARRVIQEALTNAIRYAAPATATVTVTYAETQLELDVRDTGRDRDADGPAPLPMGGRGLIGMRERVAVHEGELTAGPTQDGGFRVHARLPLEISSPEAGQRQADTKQPIGRLIKGQLFDAVLAAVLFAACQAQLVAQWEHRGSLVADTAILLGLTAPVAARRRAPVAAAGLTMGFLILVAVTPLNAISPNAMLFVLLIPPYSAGAHARRGPALAGLTICVAGWLGTMLFTSVGPPAWAVLSTGLIVAAWLTGRAIRARRRTASELSRTAALLSAGAEGLARLAIADERTRIARRLQAEVAATVADMIVQARAARILLDHDPAAFDAAMAETDRTGRRALDEMRAVLGVLRTEARTTAKRNTGAKAETSDTSPELAPQPGVGRLPALVEDVRKNGCDIELRIDGEPRPVPALCDLGVYRIAEEALRTLAAPGRRRPAMPTAALTVTFGDTWIALDVTAVIEPGRKAGNGPRWPTPVMVERAALSGGTIECAIMDGGMACLRLELRTATEEVML